VSWFLVLIGYDVNITIKFDLQKWLRNYFSGAGLPETAAVSADPRIPETRADLGSKSDSSKKEKPAMCGLS
jgi:hypothetical protein